VFFHFNDVPVGMQDFPGEGWPMFSASPEVNPTPVSIGGFNAPQTFHSTIVPTDKDGRPLDEDWILTLLFGVDVEAQQILVSGAIAGGSELTELLELVRSARPLRWWQRRALLHVVGDITERAAAFSFYEGEEPWDATVDDDEVHRDAAGWEASQGRAAERFPLGRRRNRVTVQLLTEVAQTYREAWEAGEPPTRAVSAHFNTSHSTAARWVARARKDGLLGPPDGSRGGELS
jgi:hypothetical protein